MKVAPHREGRTFALASLLFSISFLFALPLLSCADGKAVTDSPNPTLETATIHVGKAQVVAELARTEVERERGLMFRTTLEDGKGMLFIFDRDERLAFWMKNTRIPLSLAYIASDGTIRQIVDLEAESLATVQAERSVRYALETPKGWFERAGVGVGDSVDLHALDPAGRN
ncbi:MAG: DUF192 domain-containing protein [Rectinemataceae bacterium]